MKLKKIHKTLLISLVVTIIGWILLLISAKVFFILMIVLSSFSLAVLSVFMFEMTVKEVFGKSLFKDDE